MYIIWKKKKNGNQLNQNENDRKIDFSSNAARKIHTLNMQFYVAARFTYFLGS